MCKEAEILRKYAIARHKAYVIKDKLDMKRAKAVIKIIRVCDHFKNAKATGWISQIKNEILAILPAEDSKYGNQRQEIIFLLNQSLK